MGNPDNLYMKTRSAWRKWLEKNHNNEKCVWLTYYKKHTGKKSVWYNDAVEEAICFGWIDGQVKSIDEERYMQRYTPRTSKSRWSEPNIERAEKMIKAGKMTETGLKVYREAMKSNKIVPSVRNFKIPEYLKEILKSNEKARENFMKFNTSSQLAYAYWIDSAKTEATRQKRIKEALELIEMNKKPGMR